MVAVALLFGDLRAEQYEDESAMDSRIDALRHKMRVTENTQFSQDYHDPEKRSIANSIRVHFTDGTQTDLITVEYPIGHKRRRAEGIPVLVRKFETNLKTRFTAEKVDKLTRLMDDAHHLSAMSVVDFMTHWQL